MTDLDHWADAVLADPLAILRAAPQAVSYVGFDLPEDLLAALPAAAHLPWNADMPTPRADDWLESSFAPWTRSILEQWATGAFDHLDAVIFSRGDDSAQRLYYYCCELQRRGRIGGPQALILDIARIDRASSRGRTVAAVRGLADRLGLDDDVLATGIAEANRRRAALQQVDGTVIGAVRERIGRASLFAPIPNPDASGAQDGTSRRLLIAGTPPPDDRLYRAVETAGWTVVGEAHERGLTRLGPPLDVSDDPAAAIGARLHDARFGPRSFADPAATLLAEAARVRADAVLLWLIEQEESIVWHVPSQRGALERAGLPALVLTRRAWNGSDGLPDAIAHGLAEIGR